MTIKDSLTLYEELVAAGIKESEARIQAHQLGSIGVYLCESMSAMNAKFEKIDKDLMWMRAIGAGMIIACFGVMFK